jgi:hypothetical protein
MLAIDRLVIKPGMVMGFEIDRRPVHMSDSRLIVVFSVVMISSCHIPGIFPGERERTLSAGTIRG